MIDTFQGLAVTLLALLPGALYTYGFERRAGRWGTALADRLLRFLAASALLHVLLAPATYQAYRTLVHSRRIADGRPLPWWLWLVLLGYVAVPALLGDQVGRATRRSLRWARFFTGPTPAPRAWDHLFAREGLTGWVRLRLLDPGSASATATGGPAAGTETVTGRWLVGAYSGPATPDGLGAYAAGYPEVQDLYLADTADCDPATGAFLLDAAGQPVLRGVGVLVRWDQVAYLEFIEG